MGKGNLIIAIVWIVFGIIIAKASYGLGLGNLVKPGAGLVPFCLGIILFLCSFPILIRSFVNIEKAGKGKEEGIWSEIDFKKIAVALASLIVYLIFLERLGFLVTAFLILLILFKVVGSQKWSRALIATVLAVSCSYLLFVLLLKVYMPSFHLW